MQIVSVLPKNKGIRMITERVRVKKKETVIMLDILWQYSMLTFFLLDYMGQWGFELLFYVRFEVLTAVATQSSIFWNYITAARNI
jgi:hypothetical protein